MVTKILFPGVSQTIIVANTFTRNILFMTSYKFIPYCNSQNTDL